MDPKRWLLLFQLNRLNQSADELEPAGSDTPAVYPRVMDTGRGSGRFRHSITVQRSTITVNSSGQDEFTWSNLAELRADVIQGRSVEQFDSFQRSAARTFKFRLRRSTTARSIMPRDRLRWAGQTLQISSVAPLLDEVQLIATQDF